MLKEKNVATFFKLYGFLKWEVILFGLFDYV